MTGTMYRFYSKIGIRPTIDERRKGVRESFEAQTMGMAQRAASFLSASLRYPDGSPVQCVIADNCIGGMAEAVQTTEKSVGRILAFRLSSRPVGVTAAKRWTWTRTCPKRFGVSMAPNGCWNAWTERILEGFRILFYRFQLSNANPRLRFCRIYVVPSIVYGTY